MASLRLFLSVALVAAIAAAGAERAAAADFSGLAAWVGKYPFDRVRGRTLLDYPGLRPEIQRLLGAQAYAEWNIIRGPSPPVMRVGEHVAANYCQAHDCADKNTTILVHLRTGAIALCWTNQPATAGARWFVSGRAVKLERDPSCPGNEDEVRASLRRLGL